MKTSAQNTELHAPAARQGVETAAQLVLALALWGGCGAAAAGGIVGTNIKAVAATPAVVRRANALRSLDLSGPRMPPPASVGQGLRGSAQPGWRTQSIGEIRIANEPAASAAGPISIHWQSQPEIVRVARQVRRNGLPIVRLWQSGPHLLAIGLSPHGVPGIYFTQKVPD